ncbi:MAG: PHB depolymerase family esterase [Flavobacteriales bacterium]|nr:PHB depolymerase family esterase [Flavobacteriales bacterium]
MKYILINFILINFIWATAQKGEIVSIKELDHNPGNLKGSLYIPPKLKNNNKKKPLIVMLHGCNQTPQQMMDITGIQKYADSLEFYILLPEQKMLNNPSRCFNWFNEEDYSYKENGEGRSIINMINYVKGNYQVDVNSIHLIGLSAGAAMANALMVHFPDIFHSGAILAGGPTGNADNMLDAMKVMKGDITKTVDEYSSDCEHCKKFKRFPKVMIVHGTDDAVVDYQSALECQKQWSAFWKKEIRDTIYNSHYLNNDRLSTVIQTDSMGKEIIKLVTIKDFGHKVAQFRGDCFGQSGKEGLFAEDIHYNVTIDIINFFGLIKRRIKVNRTDEPSWENKYVSLKRYCDDQFYQLETSTDSCQGTKFVNYTIANYSDGCEIPDYYFIFK